MSHILKPALYIFAPFIFVLTFLALPLERPAEPERAKRERPEIEAEYLMERAYDAARTALAEKGMPKTAPGNGLVRGKVVTEEIGQYYYTIEDVSDAALTKRKITAFAAVPAFQDPLASRAVEITVARPADGSGETSLAVVSREEVPSPYGK
jgi:hypothetical protein